MTLRWGPSTCYTVGLVQQIYYWLDFAFKKQLSCILAPGYFIFILVLRSVNWPLGMRLCSFWFSGLNCWQRGRKSKDGVFLTTLIA